GRGDDADDRGIAIKATQRDAEAVTATHKVGGAINWIDHPSQAAGPDPTALLSLEAIRWEIPSNAFRKQLFNCPVRIRKPILSTLQFGWHNATVSPHTQSQRSCLARESDRGLKSVAKCAHRIPARIKLCTNCR